MNKKAVLERMLLAFVMLTMVVLEAEGLDSNTSEISRQANSPNVVGEWEFKLRVPERTLQETMTISKNAEGKYSGTFSTQGEKSEINDIILDNGRIIIIKKANPSSLIEVNTIITKYEIEHDGTLRTVSETEQMTGPVYEGTIKDGQIKGDVKWIQSHKFEGTLQGEPKKGDDAIVGDWKITNTIPSRETVGKMIIKKANGMFFGKWVDQRKEKPILNVKFKNGNLTFSRIEEFGGRKITLTFEGTVEGDNLKGKFTSERGECEANATRAGAAKMEPAKPSRTNQHLRNQNQSRNRTNQNRNMQIK
jgi:hypothetical protein